MPGLLAAMTIAVPQLRPQPLPPGTTLSRGRYTVEQVLGQGGFGYVYLASDRQGLTYAVKQCIDLSSEGLMQFGHEGAVQKIVNDATFVRVYAQFVEKAALVGGQAMPESLFTVMEYVPGASLEQLLDERLQRGQGPFAEPQAVPWIVQVLGALHHAHAVGVIHRDIKPSNILLLPDGRSVKIIDFGIAKIGGSGTQTLQGARGVSPGYSPPEQYAQSGQTDAFSDIYAVGATLYHLLTGCAPVDAPVRQSGQALVPPRRHNPAISALVEDVILQAMQLDVSHRFQSALEMQAALQGVPAPLRTRVYSQPPAANARQTLVLATAAVRDIRDLPAACYEAWPEAVNHLTTGKLEQWLQSQATQGQQLLLAIPQLRKLHPQAPDLQLDTLLRQIDPQLPASQLQVRPARPAAVRLEEGLAHSTRLEIANSGQGYLVGSIECSDAWLKIAPARVFCAPGQAQRFSVVIDTAGLGGLPSGRQYTTRVLVQTNGGAHTLVYPVQVTTTPRIIVQPDRLDFGDVSFLPPPARELLVENVGTGRLHVNLQSHVPWLQVTPHSLTVGPQEQQGVLVELTPQLVDARGPHQETIRLTAGTFGARDVPVAVNFTGPLALSAAPAQPLRSLAELVSWCDGHWHDAIRMLRNGELVAAIEYLNKPKRGAARPKNGELPALVLDKIRQASAWRDENIALETILRSLGARPPRLVHNWRSVESKLGLGWRPDLRWWWPWWSGPEPLTLVVQNRDRGYLHGRVDAAVPWLEIRQPEFGCLPGQKQRIQIIVRRHQRRLRGLAPTLLHVQVD